MNIKRKITWFSIILVLLLYVNIIPAIVHSPTEIKQAEITGVEWKERALEWKRKFQNMRDSRNTWKQRYQDCKEALEADDEDPGNSNPAIKSLSINNGKFIVNGRVTKLIGVSKPEMIVVGAGTYPSSVNYSYNQIKSAILASKINYIRVIAPPNLTYFRNEVEDYLRHGIVVEVELYDSSKPNKAYQAYWLDTFSAVKDLPVFFDAHNEFMDIDRIAKVSEIVNWVVDHGGLIGAGAWGSSNYGETFAETFKAINNKYQIVTHHRKWNAGSINSDREPGKPMLWNEIHTRDHNFEEIKEFLNLGYNSCEGVQVYSLLNWGMGPGSNFQKILDYAGGLVK